MLGCYFLSVLRKESLEIIIFLKMLLLCILAGRWNLPIVFKLRVFHSLFIIGPLWKSVNSNSIYFQMVQIVSGHVCSNYGRRSAFA